MLHVDDGVQTFAKEIGVTAIVLFGLHENLPENEHYGLASWHFPIFDSDRESLFVNMLRLFQGELLKEVLVITGYSKSRSLVG